MIDEIREQSNPVTGARPERLGRALEERLAAYALSAGAGMLVLAQPARAQIVYTPAHRVLHDNVITIDLNHDGQNDFTFRQSTTGLDEGRIVAAAARSPQASLLEERIRGVPFAARLASGVIIGSSRKPWIAYGRLASEYAGYTNGPWKDAKNGYLGLRLVVNGEDHYGWARFSVQPGLRRLLLTGYAYNTVPNQPLKAGQTQAGRLGDSGAASPIGLAGEQSSVQDSDPAWTPATLGLLALGSLGLDFWRSR